MSGEVVAVSCSASHSMSKPARETIKLLSGLAVEGDAHLGKTGDRIAIGVPAAPHQPLKPV